MADVQENVEFIVCYSHYIVAEESMHSWLVVHAHDENEIHVIAQFMIHICLIFKVIKWKIFR